MPTGYKQGGGARIFWDEPERVMMFDAVYEEIKDQLPIRDFQERYRIILNAYNHQQTMLLPPSRRRDNLKFTPEALNGIYNKMQKRKHNRKGKVRIATKRAGARTLLPVPYVEQIAEHPALRHAARGPHGPAARLTEVLLDKIADRVTDRIFDKLAIT